MLILGIETATSVCGVALVNNGILVAESRLVGPNLHNERLHMMMRTLFAQTRLKPPQVDGVAVSIGPGSFTGLRIGLAAAKGLVLATGAKLVGISTLQSLAEQAPHTAELVCVLITAKADLFYLGQFRLIGGTLQAEGTPQVVASGFLPQAVPPGAILMGPGCQKLSPAVLSQLQGRVSVDLSLASVPSAATVALLGYRRLLHGGSDDPLSLEPVYVQEFVAAGPKPAVTREQRT